MSSKKKKLFQTILTANAGCGNCGKPKLSDVYDPTPIRPKPNRSISQKYENPNFSSSSYCGRSSTAGFSLMDNEGDCMTNSTTITFNKNSNTSTTTAQNSESETDPKTKPFKIRDDSIAVVKDSNDPFQDFRHSMLQMILEKNIYSKDDLEELLNRFLELNSPSLHNVIVRAFSEIWNSDEIIKKKRSCVGCVSHDDHEQS